MARKKRGRLPAGVTLLDDGRSVFLEVPDITPVMQMHISASLEAVDGDEASFDIYSTIHRLRPEFRGPIRRPTSKPTRTPIRSVNGSSPRCLVSMIASVSL